MGYRGFRQTNYAVPRSTPDKLAPPTTGLGHGDRSAVAAKAVRGWSARYLSRPLYLL